MNLNYRLFSLILLLETINAELTRQKSHSEEWLEQCELVPLTVQTAVGCNAASVNEIISLKLFCRASLESCAPVKR